MMLRTGRFGKEMDPLAAEFTSSLSDDLRIFKEVVRINIAHALMLADQGILKKEEVAALLPSLLELYEKDPRELELKPELEDIHMVVENYIASNLGMGLGGKLHTAKSRNDQVAAAIRLRLREDLLEVESAIVELTSALVEVAERNLKVLMPGYTHLQVAEPTTFAHFLLAYVQAFLRDMRRLEEAYESVNSSPMGACALAGTSFPINRGEVANLLGFKRVDANTMDAVGSRDTLVESLGALAISMATLSRLAEEIIIMSSGEFSFLELPDEFSSTSSIMPQKKNQVVAEIARAKSAKVIGNLAGALSVLKALPQAYSLDLQELTPLVWSSVDDTRVSFKVMAKMLRNVKVNSEVMRAAVTRGFAIATELANSLVKKYGLSFREAHSVVGYMVAKAVESGKSISQLSVVDLERAAKEVLGKEIKISMHDFDIAVDPLNAVRSKEVEGGPAPKVANSQLRDSKKKLKQHKKFVDQRRKFIQKTERRLMKRAKELIKWSKSQ